MSTRVWNIDRNSTLMTNGRVADSFWSRTKGLIGVKRLDAGDGLLIEPCNSVHCFFMSIPIDVLYLDGNNRIIGMDKALQPWRIGKPHWRAKRVLELPAGTIEQTGTQVGDRLHIE